MGPNDTRKKFELGSQMCLFNMWVWGENGQLLYNSPTQRWPRKAVIQKILPKGKASEDAVGSALWNEKWLKIRIHVGLRPMGNGSSGVSGG